MDENEKELVNKIHKILIVDDEEDIRDSLLLTLKKYEDLETQIITATNGDDALTKMMNEEFDMVIADFKMPGMNGIDLLSQVSEKYPNAARILITGFSDIETAKEAINKAKVDSYVEKPWHNKELRTIVEQALVRKNERKLWAPQEVDNIKEALKIVKEAQNDMINKISTMGSKQVILLEFNSSAEFNKFSFEVRRLKNVAIDDMEIFENKYIVKLGIYLESFEKII